MKSTSGFDAKPRFGDLAGLAAAARFLALALPRDPERDLRPGRLPLRRGDDLESESVPEHWHVGRARRNATERNPRSFRLLGPVRLVVY